MKVPCDPLHPWQAGSLEPLPFFDERPTRDLCRDTGLYPVFLHQMDRKNDFASDKKRFFAKPRLIFYKTGV